MPTLVRYWGGHLKSAYQARAMWNELRGSVAAGWNTHLVCSTTPGSHSWLADIETRGVTVHDFPRPVGNFDWRCVQRVRRLCDAVDCDVFHCDNMHTSPLIGAAIARTPIRIWFKRSMEPAFENCRRPSLRDRIALSLRVTAVLCTRIVAVSEAVRQELVGLGIPATRVGVLPNPRPPDACGLNSADARARLGLPSDALVLATVGRARPVKGWDVLIDAFARAKVSTRTILVLVGSTDGAGEIAYAQLLRERIVAHGLDQRVLLAGYFQDVNVALAASDVFVLPSRSEGCSNTLIEAICAGLPCIATNVGSAQDVIEHGVTGLIVPRNDGGALAGALETLVNDDDCREKMRVRVAERVPSLPSFEEYGARMFELYRELLDCRAMSASRRTTATLATGLGSETERQCRSVKIDRAAVVDNGAGNGRSARRS